MRDHYLIEKLDTNRFSGMQFEFADDNT